MLFSKKNCKWTDALPLSIFKIAVRNSENYLLFQVITLKHFPIVAFLNYSKIDNGVCYIKAQAQNLQCPTIIDKNSGNMGSWKFQTKWKIMVAGKILVSMLLSCLFCYFSFADLLSCDVSDIFSIFTVKMINFKIIYRIQTSCIRKSFQPVEISFRYGKTLLIEFKLVNSNVLTQIDANNTHNGFAIKRPNP